MGGDDSDVMNLKDWLQPYLIYDWILWLGISCIHHLCLEYPSSLWSVSSFILESSLGKNPVLGLAFLPLMVQAPQLRYQAQSRAEWMAVLWLSGCMGDAGDGAWSWSGQGAALCTQLKASLATSHPGETCFHPSATGMGCPLGLHPLL